jgi:hypothetical protein
MNINFSLQFNKIFFRRVRKIIITFSFSLGRKMNIVITFILRKTVLTSDLYATCLFRLLQNVRAFCSTK